MNITDYIVPGLLLIIFIIMTFKAMPSFDIFINGAKDATSICVAIFPYIASVMIAVQLMRISGMTDFLITTSSPMFRALGVPPEIIELIIVRPFSGSGSTAVYNTILAEHGVDSYISRCASVLMGSSETIFYIVSVYFASSGVKKLRYALPVALFASFLGVIIACNFCRIM